MKSTEAIEIISIDYIGNSMHPILKTGDRLHTVPYDGKKIRRGDVVVFIPPGGESQIIHRVVSVDSHVIKTRGDNCNEADNWILSPDLIIGRVVLAQAGKRRRRIFGGPLGELLAVSIRTIQAIDSNISFLLRPVYYLLARSGACRRLIPSPMETKVVAFDRPDGTELQLLMGRRIIGRWLPGKMGWSIRRPFRLIVDEKSLPENKAEVSGVPPTLY